jgi:hypothetical protein
MRGDNARWSAQPAGGTRYVYTSIAGDDSDRRGQLRCERTAMPRNPSRRLICTEPQ